MTVSTVAQLGIPGGVEMLVVLLIGVLLFGAQKIPETARAAGQAIGEFKLGAEESQKELNGDQDTSDTGEPS